jgi:hypothetical protein
MKKIFCFSTVLLFLALRTVAQVSFALSSSACVNTTVQATANSGTIGNATYTWTSLPSGVSFSNGNSASPVLSFSSSGIYTVIVSMSSGTVITSAQNTINIIALPIVSAIANPSLVCNGYSSTVTALGASNYTWNGSTFTGSIFQASLSVGPGTFTVSGANSAGCINNKTISILAIPNFTPGITASSYTTCIEYNASGNYPSQVKSVTLFPSGATNYSWSLPPCAILINNFVISTCTATSQFSFYAFTSVCSGSNVVTVSVVPQFTIGASPTYSTICAGNSVELSLSQAGVPFNNIKSYDWTEQDQVITTLNTDTMLTAIASPLSKRIYSLTVRDNRGCISSPTSLTIDVSPCTQVNENFQQKTLKIFPNPFEAEFFVETANDGISIEIKDCIGKLILGKEINSIEKLTRGNTENLNPGIYFLTVFSFGDKSRTIKIFKN